MSQSIKLCSIGFGLRTQSNTIRWIEFDWVRFVRLNSICSEIELTESLVFDFVRLPNSIELYPRIEFDWVRFSNVRFTMPGMFELKNGMFESTKCMLELNDRPGNTMNACLTWRMAFLDWRKGCLDWRIECLKQTIPYLDWMMECLNRPIPYLHWRIECLYWRIESLNRTIADLNWRIECLNWKIECLNWRIECLNW